MDLVTNVAAGAQAAGAKSKVVGREQRVRRQILSSQANRVLDFYRTVKPIRSGRKAIT
jgi:hypothetical protein